MQGLGPTVPFVCRSARSRFRPRGPSGARARRRHLGDIPVGPAVEFIRALIFPASAECRRRRTGRAAGRHARHDTPGDHVMTAQAPIAYDAFIDLAADDSAVVGLVLKGSQAHEGMATQRSDHDLYVGLADGDPSRRRRSLPRGGGVARCLRELRLPLDQEPPRRTSARRSTRRHRRHRVPAGVALHPRPPPPPLQQVPGMGAHPIPLPGWDTARCWTHGARTCT